MIKIEEKIHIEVSREDIKNILIDYFRDSQSIHLKECDFHLGTEPRGEYDVQVLKNFTATGARIDRKS